MRQAGRVHFISIRQKRVLRLEGTEKVTVYQKRLFSIRKTASFSLTYSDRWWRVLSYRRFSEPLFYLYNNLLKSKGLFQCPHKSGGLFLLPDALKRRIGNSLRNKIIRRTDRNFIVWFSGEKYFWENPY